MPRLVKVTLGNQTTVIDSMKLYAVLGSGETVKTVKTDGTGDYLTPAAANTAITDASPAKPYLVLISEGVYEDAPDWIPKPDIRFVGVNQDRVRLRLFQADNAITNDIVANSQIRFHGDARLENLTVEVRNGRYAIHDESAGADKDWTHYLRRVTLIHHGNAGARTYRDANPGSGLGTSADLTLDAVAYGYGSSSGGDLIQEDCTFIGAVAPWLVHNNADFTSPNTNVFRRCRLVSGDASGAARQAFSMTGLGSTTADEITLENCEISATVIRESDYPWLKIAGVQYADHSDYALTLAGCSPVAWTTTNRGKALMVQSASTGTTSTVRLSGTALPVLIGTVRNVDGGGGLKGYSYGSLDMSAITGGGDGAQPLPANSLAERLGNRTSSAVTLTVSIDGAAGVNVVFNADHSAQSDATILGLINTALGSAGTASLYLLSQGETYPQVLDKQRTCVNGGTTGIPRWAAVVYAAPGRQQVKTMGTGDAAALFVGVALEPIPPGKTGRILTEGILDPTQLYGTSTTGAGGAISGILGGSFTVGAAIYASDTLAGGFATSGTRKLAEAPAASFAYFKAPAA